MTLGCRETSRNFTYLCWVLPIPRQPPTLRPSGSMSGVWKRSMVEMVGHPRTKGRATGENKPRPKPPRHTSTLPTCYGMAQFVTANAPRLRDDPQRADRVFGMLDADKWN